MDKNIIPKNTPPTSCPSHLLEPPLFEFELQGDICWLEDPRKFRFLRQCTVRTTTRWKSIKWRIGRVIGFEILDCDVMHHQYERFARSVFYIKPHDDMWQLEPSPSRPTEAVLVNDLVTRCMI